MFLVTFIVEAAHHKSLGAIVKSKLNQNVDVITFTKSKKPCIPKYLHRFKIRFCFILFKKNYIKNSLKN